MQAEPDRTADDRQTDGPRLDALWQQIQQHLEAERDRIKQEIWHYPPPIPACDAQYNSLLEERATILQEIDRVDDQRKRRLPAAEQLAALTEFLQSSRHLKGEFAERIRQTLAGLLASVTS